MKKRGFAIGLAVVMALSMAACGKQAGPIGMPVGSMNTEQISVDDLTTEEKTTEEKTTEEVTTEEPTTEEPTTEANHDVTLSDDILSYEVALNGQVIKFPLMFTELEAMGWEASDDRTTGIPSERYTLFYFKKGDDKIMTYVMNFDVNEVPASECVICGVKIDDFTFKGVAELPGGVMFGGTQTDVRNAYGTPDKVYESDSYPSDTYEEASYSYVEFTYRHEDGDKIYEVSIENFVEPEGFVAAEIDTESVPEITTAYVAPTELSTNLLDYTVEYDGDLYKLPCPVSQFIANGWEIVENESEDTITGTGSGKVTLRKNSQEFWAYVRNYDQNATVIENCFVQDLEANIYKTDVSMKISNGIEKGGAESTIESALTGYTFEKSDEGSYIRYLVSDERSLTYHYEIIVREGKIDSIDVQYDPRVSEYRKDMGFND